MPTELLTVREILKRTAAYLQTKGSQSPRLDAELLLAEALSTDRMGLYLEMERPLSQEEIEQYRESVRRRAACEPVAYILGYREFYGLPFAVDKRTLIPRPETELLVEEALRLAPRPTPRIVDVGTGSGAIAIALARHIEEAALWATDVSEGALEVARENAGQLGVAGRIEFACGDLFAGFDGPFDLIVSNPPYVAEGDRASMQRDVSEFEPQGALFAGADGLDTIRRLVAESPARLDAGGYLLFEIGQGQAGAVEALICATAGLSFERSLPDLARIPRVAVARKKE